MILRCLFNIIIMYVMGLVHLFEIIIPAHIYTQPHRFQIFAQEFVHIHTLFYHRICHPSFDSKIIRTMIQSTLDYPLLSLSKQSDRILVIPQFSIRRLVRLTSIANYPPSSIVRHPRLSANICLVLMVADNRKLTVFKLCTTANTRGRCFSMLVLDVVSLHSSVIH